MEHDPQATIAGFDACKQLAKLAYAGDIDKLKVFNFLYFLIY